jgi:RNA polymerase sigma-70 factor, ECF subfamily
MARAVANAAENLRSLPEDELVRRALIRDQAALREIMTRNSPRLYRTARSILRSEGDAEEVVQETYLRAFAHIDRFRGEAKMSTWLTRIALNEALGRLRRGFKTVALSQAEEVASGAAVVPFPAAAGEDDPERIVARRQIGALLERAIDALPHPFRVVFVMRMVEDMSVRETAALLEVPEATVKTRLHRAKLLLRKTLEPEIGNALADVFPFAGRRCSRIAESVLSRLGPDTRS